MTISAKDWENYIRKLSALDKKAGDMMLEYVRKHGFSDVDALIDYAYAVATKYGEGSAALAAAMYDAIAEIQGYLGAPAEVAPTPEYGEVAKTVSGILKKSQNADMLSNAVGRLVKRTGADTMLKNAERDGAQFAWVPNGDTCAFCITLASRGWQYMSTKALKNGHAEHIHSNCDCTYAVRFDKKSGVAGYDPKVYQDMYYGAEGNTPKEKINAIRRMKYQENKEKINAQKREAYAERKLTNDIGGSSIKAVSEKDVEGHDSLRIPQIPASTISEKIESGEYSLKLSQQSYDKHVEGNQTYEVYLNARKEKGSAPQSKLSISKDEAQRIINNQSGTGIIRVNNAGEPTNVEYITCEKNIGYYYNGEEYVPTRKAAIHHGRKGSHIVPIKGGGYD